MEAEALKKELYDMATEYIEEMPSGEGRTIMLFEGVLLERIEGKKSTRYFVKETSSEYYTDISNKLIINLIIQHVKSKQKLSEIDAIRPEKTKKARRSVTVLEGG